MKKFIYLLLAVYTITACKKEDTTSTTPTTPVILKSVTYTHATNTSLNKVFNIYRNANKLIDSVVISGADASTYKRYVFYHTAERLDSVLQYNSSNTMTFRSIATWTGNNLTAFWTLNYQYDTDNRITKKIYTSGSFFRVEHFADSSVFNYDEIGADPEYKSYVQYYNKSVKNPFKMYKYENTYAMNNFIFNAISSDFNGMYTYPFGNFNEYNLAGALISRGSYNYSGDFKGYPLSVQYITNSATVYTLTLSYE